jgi:RNase H-like domain found in reverse transcriptase
LTRSWRKKIEAILKIEQPRNIGDVRSFVGAVTFYRELFPWRSHILNPLYELTAKGVKFQW